MKQTKKKANHPGMKNLKNPTAEEARERGKKGGIASGLARKKRKDLMECLNHLIKMDHTVVEKKMIDGSMQSIQVTASGAEFVSLALIRKAMAGNVLAAKEILDRIHGKVVDKSEIKQQSVVVSIDEEDIKAGAQKLTDLMKKLRDEG